MSQKDPRKASSATAGFFQTYPTIPPGYSSRARTSTSGAPPEDRALANILGLYLPDSLPDSLDTSIHEFAQTCLDPKTLRLTVDCETNHPTLHPLTTFGEVNNVNALRTSEGWRGLKDIQTKAGIVAHGYRPVSEAQQYNLRVHQFALAHLWSPSSAAVSCPAAMSDGAAILLSKHLAASQPTYSPNQDATALRRVLQEAYDRLVSFDPEYAWTSGQWMTERPGGSDVTRTETVAHLASSSQLEDDLSAFGGEDCDGVGMPLGPWVIDGFKWFSSATDADMVVMLAQTDKGLSAFYAPMKRRRSAQGKSAVVMNGVRISRLKNKLGTKGLPTAELEIQGMRGWLLGEEGKGVKEISAILNATRLWTACGAVGGWSRALSVVRAYAHVRKIKGEELLVSNRQHLKWMADETVRYHGCAHFAFLGVALLGLTEVGWQRAASGTYVASWLPQQQDQAKVLLRVLTPVMKAQCSLWATWGTRECMEALGGVGYCENVEDGGTLNIARMLRDGAVNSIWEGTTNILAEDFVRAISGKNGRETLASLDGLFNGIVNSCRSAYIKEAELLLQQWSALLTWLKSTSHETLLYHGRRILLQAHSLMATSLLLVNATRTQSALDAEIARRWASWVQRWEDVVAGGLDLAIESDAAIFLGYAHDKQAKAML